MRRGLLAGLLMLAATAQAADPPTHYYNSFEFSDMRPALDDHTDGIWWGDGVVTMGANEMPDYPSQPAGIKTGMSILTRDPHTVTYINDASICRNGSNWCLRHNVATNVNGNQAMTWLHEGGGLGVPDHLFVRAWYRFPTGYNFVFGKFFYLRDFGGNTFHVNPTDNATTTSLRMEDEGSGPNPVCNLSLPCQITGDNLWHSIEVEINPGTSTAAIIRLWLDNVLVLEYCPACAQQDSVSAWDDPGVGLGHYFNATANGGVGTLGAPQVFYMDDLAVSSTRIGGDASDLIAPAAPTNLHVVSP